LLPVLAGCIKVDQTLSLAKDGSARLEVSYSIAEEAVDRFQSMFELEARMARVAGETLPKDREDAWHRLLLQPEEEAIRNRLAGYDKYGMRVDKLKVESRGGRREVQIVLLAEDLARAAESDLFRQYGFSLRKNRTGNYVFYRPGKKPPQDAAQQPDPEDSEQLSPLLAGFKVHIRVNTPGRILETNAAGKGLYAATWTFDFDREPTALADLQRQDLYIVFDGRGLTLPEVAPDDS
jgi:hypothetical protein